MAGTIGGSKEKGKFKGAKKILRIEASIIKVEASKRESAAYRDEGAATNRSPPKG